VSVVPLSIGPLLLPQQIFCHSHNFLEISTVTRQPKTAHH
jgi:hypothetical protein